MNADQRASLIGIRDRLSGILIELDGLLETDARYQAQVEHFHTYCDLRDRRDNTRHSRRVTDRTPVDLWGGIKFGRASEPVGVAAGVAHLRRVNNEDGA